MKLAKLPMIFLALAAGVASADIENGRPRFNWTNPPDWSDGTALTAEQIVGYQINCGTTYNFRVDPNGVPPTTVPATPAAPMLPGDYTCGVSVIAKYTPTSPEVTGAPSTVNFTVPQPSLGAVTGLSVE